MGCLDAEIALKGQGVCTEAGRVAIPLWTKAGPPDVGRD